MSRIPPDSGKEVVPRRGFVRVAGVLLVVALTTACATKRDVRELRAELTERAARQDSIMVQIVRLLGQVEDSVSSNSSDMLETRADLMRELLDVQDQLVQVQELAGQNQASLQRMRQEIREDRRQLALPPPVATGTDNADEVFQAAMDAHARGSYSAARRGFEAFVQAHAEDERVTDAEFFIAEIVSRGGTDEDIDAAIQRYEEIRSTSPDHPRAPQALYASGLLEMERGNLTEAADYFDRVATGWDTTEWAAMARERLAEIR